MAFFDWNGDGKKDFTDDFIEYNIYRNCMKNGNTPKVPRSQPSDKGFWIVFLISCVVACFNQLLAAIIFGGVFTHSVYGIEWLRIWTQS